MKKHTMKEWLIAVRPWSFPASAMPVVATLGYLFARHDDANTRGAIISIIAAASTRTTLTARAR